MYTRPSKAASRVCRIDPIDTPASASTLPARMPPAGIMNNAMPNRRTLSEMKMGRAMSTATGVAHRPARSMALAVGQASPRQISVVVAAPSADQVRGRQ